MKNYNMVLTEKQQKKAKFTYSTFEKALEK